MTVSNLLNMIQTLVDQHPGLLDLGVWTLENRCPGLLGIPRTQEPYRARDLLEALLGVPSAMLVQDPRGLEYQIVALGSRGILLLTELPGRCRNCGGH